MGSFDSCNVSFFPSIKKLMNRFKSCFDKRGRGGTRAYPSLLFVPASLAPETKERGLFSYGWYGIRIPPHFSGRMSWVYPVYPPIFGDFSLTFEKHLADVGLFLHDFLICVTWLYFIKLYVFQKDTDPIGGTPIFLLVAMIMGGQDSNLKRWRSLRHRKKMEKVLI